MAVQTNVSQDARRRSDEYDREAIATAGGVTPNAVAGAPVIDTSVDDKLIRLLEKSAQSLRHASENVESRGLKLLLKVVAQQRVHMLNSLREAMGKREIDPLDPSRQSSGSSLQQGLQDIQTSMTVQRQGRENVALNHLLSEEDELVATYATALEGLQPSALRETLEAQRTQVSNFDARLQAAGDGIEPIVARVFDSRIEGESAITRLRERGFAPSQIDSALIGQVASPVLQTSTVPPSPKNTVAAGALSGAIVGAILGGAVAAFVWLAPQMLSWITVGPWTLLIGATVVGAVFGSIFGWLIGQSQREDDVMVTADGLVNGEILVVAYPNPSQVGVAEDVLQIEHARELNR